jgi:hypothetical protein
MESEGKEPGRGGIIWHFYTTPGEHTMTPNELISQVDRARYRASYVRAVDRGRGCDVMASRGGWR